MKKVKLNTICSLKQWKTIPKNQLIEKGYPVYGANGIIGYTDTFNHSTPTIMICCRGASCGAINVSKDKCYINGNAMALDNLDSNFLIDYVSNYLKAYDFSHVITGTAQPQITQIGLNNVYIPVLSLKEQERISNELNDINAELDICKEQLNIINELIKSQFNELFSDCTHYEKLADLSLSKGQYGAGSASIEYNPNRPRYVRITDINDDGSLNNDFVSSENLQDDSDYKLEYGDFLFARTGATVGKTYCYEKGDEIFAGYLIRFRLNTNKIIPKYMYWYTKTEQYLNWVRLNQSGAAQPGINEKKYSNLIVLVPPINKQKIFIEFVKQCDKLKFIYHWRYFL